MAQNKPFQNISETPLNLLILPRNIWRVYTSTQKPCQTQI